MNNNNSQHQEKSEIYYLQNVQQMLFEKTVLPYVKDSISKQVYKLGIWQVQQWITAKQEKEQGKEGLCHTISFDN